MQARDVPPRQPWPGSPPPVDPASQGPSLLSPASPGSSQSPPYTKFWLLPIAPGLGYGNMFTCGLGSRSLRQGKDRGDVAKWENMPLGEKLGRSRRKSPPSRAGEGRGKLAAGWTGQLRGPGEPGCGARQR